MSVKEIIMVIVTSTDLTGKPLNLENCEMANILYIIIQKSGGGLLVLLLFDTLPQSREI